MGRKHKFCGTVRINKKIKGARALVEDGIHFKSVLESKVYHELKLHGIEALYEPHTISLWQGHHPITPFYTKDKSKKKLKGLILNKRRLADIKYTPDFYFRFKNLDIWIEVKGFENDVFYIKKKLFISYLDEQFSLTKQKSIYFEIFNISQLREALAIIERYAENQDTTD